MAEQRNAEQTWLRSNDLADLLAGPLASLAVDRGNRFKRKLRLFGTACLRRISYLFKDEQTRRWIDTLEQATDAWMMWEEYSNLVEAVIEPPNEDQFAGDPAESYGTRAAAWQALCLVSEYELGPRDASNAAAWAREAAYPHPVRSEIPNERQLLHGEREASVQVAILRDIFGNPFVPVAIDPTWLAWNDGIVFKLAQGIYDDRAFDQLPILADALEEAGCSNVDILSHLRGPGSHVRGCWPVDLCLDKG
jgi:hypothetical protein